MVPIAAATTTTTTTIVSLVKGKKKEEKDNTVGIRYRSEPDGRSRLAHTKKPKK